MRLPAAKTGPSPKGERLQHYLRGIPPAFYGLIFIIILYSLVSPGFLTTRNILTLLIQGSMLLVISLGMTLVVLSGGVDLSLGALLSLCGVVMAMMLVSGQSLFMAIIVTLLVGVLCGLTTGTLVARFGLQPFVASFGMLGVCEGIALVFTDGSSIIVRNPYLRSLAASYLMGIPMAGWFAGLCFVAFYVILYKTRFGAYVYGIGGNEEATILSGIRVIRYKTGIYVLAGLSAAMASLIMTGRLNAAHPFVAIGYEFDAVASVIVGGTAFERGRGGIWGTLVGVAFISVLRNGLNIIGVNPFAQVPVIGAVIILAIILGKAQKR
ncbi:MAG: ABC transporter permease [Bacillota bacterium]